MGFCLGLAWEVKTVEWGFGQNKQSSTVSNTDLERLVTKKKVDFSKRNTVYGDGAASGKWQPMTFLLQTKAGRVWFTSNNLTHIWPKKIKRWFIASREAWVLARSTPVGQTWWDVKWDGSELLLTGAQKKCLTDTWGLQRAVREVCASEGKPGAETGSA